jgi:hypothetical protein
MWCYLGRLLYCHQKIFDPRIISRCCPLNWSPPVFGQIPFTDLLAATCLPILAAWFLKAQALWFDLGRSDHSSTHVTLGIRWATHALYGKLV